MTKALVIVAHPDDETIWMGGKILREKDWEWTVLSLCRKDDPDRKPKFFKVIKELHARGFISDLDDDRPEEDLPSLDEVIKRIEPVVHDKEFDYVFTHGPSGEYGHKRHIEVHEAVKKISQEQMLKFKDILCFDYRRVEEPFHCEPNNSAPIKFNLTQKEFTEKRRLINEVYGFRKEIFEYLSCSKIETFRKMI